LGTPLVSTIVSSKQSDCTSLIPTVNKLPINLNTLRNSKVNRYKQHMLADAGYCSNNNKLFLKKLGYVPIIAYNKRNERNKQKIKENKLKEKQLKIFKKRWINLFTLPLVLRFAQKKW